MPPRLRSNASDTPGQDCEASRRTGPPSLVQIPSCRPFSGVPARAAMAFKPRLHWHVCLPAGSDANRARQTLSPKAFRLGTSIPLDHLWQRELPADADRYGHLTAYTMGPGGHCAAMSVPNAPIRGHSDRQQTWTGGNALAHRGPDRQAQHRLRQTSSRPPGGRLTASRPRWRLQMRGRTRPSPRPGQTGRSRARRPRSNRCCATG